jgi:hypothetical protein
MMTNNGKAILQLGEIYIDEDGTFWCYWQGTHAEQGGPVFTKGNSGSENAVDLMSIVGTDLAKNKDTHMEYIKELTEKKNG